MSLLLTKNQAVHFSRNIPRLVHKIWDELAALDSKSKVQVYIPPDAAAGNLWERAIFKAPADGTIVDILVVPDGDIGQATNFMTLDVQDKGADGTGTTSLGLRAVNSTNPIEGMVGVDLVTTNAAITEGRVLSLKKTITGTGQIWPGGMVQVNFTKQ